MRVAVTGSGGRLGSSLIGLLRGSSLAEEVLAWDLPEHNLDDPTSARRLVEANRPDAWCMAGVARSLTTNGVLNPLPTSVRSSWYSLGSAGRLCWIQPR